MNHNPETIETRHPYKRRGVKISKEVYIAIATLMLQQLEQEEEMSLAFLIRVVEERLDIFPDITQLAYHVKLDLEAKGFIRLAPSSSKPTIHVIILTAKGMRNKNKSASLLNW